MKKIFLLLKSKKANTDMDLLKSDIVSLSDLKLVVAKKRPQEITKKTKEQK